MILLCEACEKPFRLSRFVGARHAQPGRGIGCPYCGARRDMAEPGYYRTLQLAPEQHDYFLRQIKQRPSGVIGAAELAVPERE
jgi:DNA-directed RNA polymerase subunit RPC12/RpoP